MKRVAVLYGGISAERDVSLSSGKQVIIALRTAGFDVTPVLVGPDLRAVLAALDPAPDVVFNALHGRFGEDGTMQGALELMGLPYTGPGVMASAIAMDKVTTKRVWSANEMPTPRYVRLAEDQQSPAQVRAALDSLGLPLIVKPPREGSSIGITKVTGAGDIDAAVALSLRYDPDLLFEEFIEGEEVTCPVLGSGADAVALPVIRIRAPGGAYDYRNKYFTDDVQYLCPSELPDEEETEIRRIVLAAYRTLGCRGWSRADLMIRARDRKPFLLEMNTSPGMTSHSLVPMSARAAGISYQELCLRILADAALDYSPARRHAATGTTGAAE